MESAAHGGLVMTLVHPVASPVDIVHSLAVVSEEAARENRPVNCATDKSSGKAEGNTV
jgi:hypothetical protein